jgi:hypothetical protein
MLSSHLQQPGAHSGSYAFEHNDRHSSTRKRDRQIAKLMSPPETAERLWAELEQLVDLSDHPRLLQASDQHSNTRCAVTHAIPRILLFALQRLYWGRQDGMPRISFELSRPMISSGIFSSDNILLLIDVVNERTEMDSCEYAGLSVAEHRVNQSRNPDPHPADRRYRRVSGYCRGKRA